MSNYVHTKSRLLLATLACLASACADTTPGQASDSAGTLGDENTGESDDAEAGSTSDSEGNADSETTGGSNYEPLFEDADCGYPLPPEAAIRCGYLSVPEDRADLEGPWVQLHVAIFDSSASTPSAEPLFVLNGGPGSSSIPAFGLLLSPVGDLLRARQDVVYMDQRGTNLSVPSLYCLQPLDADPLSSYAEYVSANQDLYAACASDLQAAQVALSNYNTPESARDFDDLRIALGAEQVDLLAVSYGTRLAMTMMRDSPETIRSAVLDSPLPPNINPFHEGTRSLRSALDAFFVGNPGAEADFEQAAASLRAQAQVVSVEVDGAFVDVSIDDVNFVAFVRSALTSSPPDLGLASDIASAAAGNLDAVALDWIDLTVGGDVPGPGSEASAEGFFYSVFCAEDGGATSVAMALAADAEFAEANPSVRDLAVAYQLDLLLQPCETWPVDVVDDADYFDALDSSVPAVVLSGTFDPQTPPYFAEVTGAQLSASSVLSVETGHVVLATQCGAQIAGAFLADPSTVPDAACATVLPPAP